MKLFGKTSREQGSAAEELAKHHLEAHGLRSVAQNVHGRFGEIDLIMRDGPCLVFVEVRYRRSSQFGGAIASIDRRKQQRIVTTALGYLQQHPYDGPCRFDVVAIDGATNRIEWLKNAFELSE